MAPDPLAGHPAVSVIVPICDGGTALAEQLEAIGRQAGPGVELVLVDDGSRDGSLQLAERFAAAHGALVIRNPRRLGKAHALNRGVAASRAELLLMLDQDDLIADGYVHAMAAALTRSPLVFGRLEHDRLNPAWLADALRASPDQERARVLLRPERTAEPTSVRVGIGCALGMRRELFDRLGGFATDVGCTDDVDLCLRAHALGVELVRTDDAVVHYRLRRSLPALFRQRYGYGASWAALYKRHRAAGMPRPGVGRVACELVRAVRQLASASRCARARGVAGLGFTLGRMAGSRRHRVLYAF